MSEPTRRTVVIHEDTLHGALAGLFVGMGVRLGLGWGGPVVGILLVALGAELAWIAMRPHIVVEPKAEGVR